jgi:hypothetical protein
MPARDIKAIWEKPISLGKRVDHWLTNQETKDYIEALCSLSHTCKNRYLKTSRATLANGGGTWLHPKLAVRFAQWLDPKFAVWCDLQIDNLLRCYLPSQTGDKTAKFSIGIE